MKQQPRDIEMLIDHIYVIDLLKENGVDEIIRETGDVKFGFAAKAQALITGWEKGLIPDKVIHFDADIAVVATYPHFNLLNVFEPLQVQTLFVYQ